MNNGLSVGQGQAHDEVYKVYLKDTTLTEEGAWEFASEIIGKTVTSDTIECLTLDDCYKIVQTCKKITDRPEKIPEKGKKTKFAYLIFDGSYYKIGSSIDPEKRVAQLNTANPKARLVASSHKLGEKYLHEIFAVKRLFLPNGRKSEWFDLDEEEVRAILELMENGEENIGKGFSTCLGGLQAQLHGKMYYGRRVNSNARWIIPFGKFKGRKLTSMQSEEELDYIRWYIKAYRKESKKTRQYGGTYNRFCWWLGHLNKVDYEKMKEEKLGVFEHRADLL